MYVFIQIIVITKKVITNNNIVDNMSITFANNFVFATFCFTQVQCKFRHLTDIFVVHRACVRRLHNIGISSLKGSWQDNQVF